jgi:hypothetical protein
MAAKNNITGDEIKTSSYSKNGRENHDLIFAKRTALEWAKIEGFTICVDEENKDEKISYSEFKKLFL